MMLGREGHKWTRGGLCACVCAGALAIAGCGGGSSSSASTHSATQTSTSASFSVAETAGARGHSASATATAPSAQSQQNAGRKPAKTLPPQARNFLLSLLPVAESWQNASQRFNAAVNSAGGDLKKLSSAAGDYAHQTKTFAQGVADLHAPANASSQQKALISSARALDGDVTALQSAASNGNASAAQAAEKNIRKDSGAVSSSVINLAKALAGGAMSY